MTIVSISACLDHARKKCPQSGNFQFDIKFPFEFKILSARKLKAFQKYKLSVIVKKLTVTNYFITLAKGN